MMQEMHHPGIPPQRVARSWAVKRWALSLTRIFKHTVCLQIRNHSLFAHGFQAVDAGRWRELWSTLGGFLSEVLTEQHRGKGKTAAAPLAQLPNSLEQLMPSP